MSVTELTELPNVKNFDDRRAVRRLDRVEPVYLKKLKDERNMSWSQIGEVIGVSGSHLSNELAEEGGTRKAYEMAAKLYYLEDVQAKTLSVVVTASPEAIAAMTKWLNENGGMVFDLVEKGAENE